MFFGDLFSLVETVSLGAKTRGGRSSLSKVSAESRDQERSVDDVSATEDGERQPEEEDELEDVVEGEPVDDLDQALNDSEESKNNPVRQPLGIILLVVSEECLERVVTGDNKTGKVGQELAAEVEDDEEEVEGTESNNSICLGDTGLLLGVVEERVLGELTVELTKVLLSLVLSGHF